jgi:pilus assembly protein Flp/PilA
MRSQPTTHYTQETPIMKSLFTRFVRDDQGQDLIEYALLAAFVSLAAAVGAGLLGTALNGWFNEVATEVNSFTTP